MRPVGWPETSVRNCHSTLGKITIKRRSFVGSTITTAFVQCSWKKWLYMKKIQTTQVVLNTSCFRGQYVKPVYSLWRKNGQYRTDVLYYFFNCYHKITECDIDRDSKTLAPSVMEINMLIWVLFQVLLLSSASLDLPYFFPSPFFCCSGSSLLFPSPSSSLCLSMFLHLLCFIQSLYVSFSSSIRHSATRYISPYLLFILCTKFINKITSYTTAPSWKSNVIRPIHT